MALDIFEVNLLRVVIYSVSWFLKIIFAALLTLAKAKKHIPKVLAYLISGSQKVHMIALNSIAIDLIPYTLITMFHTKEMPIFTQWSSGVLLVLLILDYVEIWFKGGKSKIQEFSQQKNTDESTVLELKK